MAEPAWLAIYERLSDGPGGALEELAARGTSQVTRLACIYALLDRRTEVDLCHLTAALAVWRYTLESCARIFEADGTGDTLADRVLAALRQSARGLGTTELHHALSRNTSADKLRQALDLLLSRGLIMMTKNTGKKGAHYVATEHNTKENAA